jgi:hypothetical protein
MGSGRTYGALGCTGDDAICPGMWGKALKNITLCRISGSLTTRLGNRGKRGLTETVGAAALFAAGPRPLPIVKRGGRVDNWDAGLRVVPEEPWKPSGSKAEARSL